MLHTDSLNSKGNLGTNSKRIEKIISCSGNSKTSKISYPIIQAKWNLSQKLLEEVKVIIG